MCSYPDVVIFSHAIPSPSNSIEPPEISSSAARWQYGIVVAGINDSAGGGQRDKGDGSSGKGSMMGEREREEEGGSYRLRVAGVSLRSRFTFGAGRTTTTRRVVVIVAAAAAAFITFAATRLFRFGVQILLFQCERLLHLLFA